MDDIQGEAFWPNNYHCYHHVAMKKGYSGVAIFTKLKPNNADNKSSGLTDGTFLSSSDMKNVESQLCKQLNITNDTYRSIKDCIKT